MEKVILNALVDPYSIMAINKQGQIRKLYCPFRVLCIVSTDSIKQNSWCYVDQVAEDVTHLFVYFISKAQYPYSYFHIYINF